MSINEYEQYIDFNFTDVPDYGEPVPDGKYQVIITDAEYGLSSQKQSPQIEITLNILGPTHQHSVVKHFWSLVPNAIGYMKSYLNAFYGVKLPDEFKLAKEGNKFSSLIGKSAVAWITTNAAGYNNVTRYTALAKDTEGSFSLNDPSTSGLKI